MPCVSIGINKPLHADFGTQWKGSPIGIPFVVIGKNQKKVPVDFYYESESDRGLYPIPENVPIEGGKESTGDRHVIVVSYYEKKLYELYDVHKTPHGWKAGSGAIFDLTSNTLRHQGCTSADAAGLPIFPGLVKYDEVVNKKVITHALRFTVQRTQRGYIAPATHFASKYKNTNLPPMGLRLRLKQDYDISGFPEHVQVILKALKKYGMILADNGSDMFISGAPNKRWNDAELHSLKRVKVGDFEVVDTGKINR